jgi:hypothetical protein
LERTHPRNTRFWKSEWGGNPLLIEAFEVSEYAGKESTESLDRLFPNRKTH